MTKQGYCTVFRGPNKIYCFMALPEYSQRGLLKIIFDETCSTLEFISVNIRTKRRQISPISMNISDEFSRERRTKFDEICITLAQCMFTFFNPSRTKNVEYSSLKGFNRQTKYCEENKIQRNNCSEVIVILCPWHGWAHFSLTYGACVCTHNPIFYFSRNRAQKIQQTVFQESHSGGLTGNYSWLFEIRSRDRLGLFVN